MTLTQFALAMRNKLQENAGDKGKHGWRSEFAPYLIGRLKEELFELETVLRNPGRSADEVLSETADVANFCYMLADIETHYRSHRWDTDWD